VCAGMHAIQVFVTSVYIFANTSSARVLVCAFGISVGGRGWGGSASLYRELVADVGHDFLT